MQQHTTRIHLKPPPGPVTYWPEICRTSVSGVVSTASATLPFSNWTTPFWISSWFTRRSSATDSRWIPNWHHSRCSVEQWPSHLAHSGSIAGWYNQPRARSPEPKWLLAGSLHTDISHGNCVNMSHGLGIIAIQQLLLHLPGPQPPPAPRRWQHQSQQTSARAAHSIWLYFSLRVTERAIVSHLTTFLIATWLIAALSKPTKTKMCHTHLTGISIRAIAQKSKKSCKGAKKNNDAQLDCAPLKLTINMGSTYAVDGCPNL